MPTGEFVHGGDVERRFLRPKMKAEADEMGFRVHDEMEDGYATAMPRRGGMVVAAHSGGKRVADVCAG